MTTESTLRTNDVDRWQPMPAAIAAAIATSAYVVPYALSRSTSPSPDHPRVLFWYRLLRQPRFKPPDIAIPLTWLGIETGLAYAGYRLLRLPRRSRARVRSHCCWAMSSGSEDGAASSSAVAVFR